MTFPHSRPKLAAILVASPLLIVWEAAKAAARDVAESVDNIRQHFVPALGYIFEPAAERAKLTAFIASDMAAEARDAVVAYYKAHAHSRLVALAILVLLPVLAICAIYQLVRDEKLFSNWGGEIVNIVRQSLIGGVHPLDA